MHELSGLMGRGREKNAGCAAAGGVNNRIVRIFKNSRIVQNASH